MYKPINGWTKARMIEQVRRYVPTKGRCAEHGGHCVYQRDDGKRCAVGAFLPLGANGDQEMAEFEGTARELVAEFPFLEDVLPLTAIELEAMQVVHDLTAPQDSAQERVVQWIEKNVSDE